MQLKQKLLLTLGFITMIFIIQACRKYDFFGKNSGEFKMEDAKEWYYGVFKKSAAFKEVDRQSLFSSEPTAGTIASRHEVNYKKYPYWDKSNSYRKGSHEFIEMPLFHELNVIALPGMENLSIREKRHVAASSLQKIVFIKKPDNKIIVRLLTIVPTYDFLKSKNFDISDISFSNLDSRFSGLVSIRTWSETSIHFFSYQNGKYQKTIKIAKNVQDLTVTDAGIEMSSASSECGWVPVPVMQRYCIATTGSGGDVPPDDPTCTEWDEYETGEVDFQYVPCENEDGGGDPFQDCLAGNNPDDCVCTVYGLDCGGGDNPPGDGDGPQEDAAVVDQIEVDLTDSCLQNAVDQINVASSLGNSIGSILHETFTDWGQHDLYIKQSCIPDTATDALTTPSGGLIVITFNECALQNASQEYIAATLYHEILHAYFFAHDRMSGLNQHTDMANKYLAAMINTMMENFPTLSYADAEALAWGGLFETQAWKNLEQADPNKAMDIKFANKKHKNGDWGTKCR